MLVESTIMLNTMLTVIAKITTKNNNPGWHQWPLLIWALTEPSSDVELAGSAWRLSVTLLLAFSFISFSFLDGSAFEAGIAHLREISAQNLSH